MRRVSITAAVLASLLLGIIPPSLALAAAPANDNFAAASVVSSLPFSASVSNTEATVELNEPITCNGQSQTVWWRYTAPADQVLHVDNVGSDRFDAGVLVFHAQGPSITDLAFVACATFLGSTAFSVQAGETYYFEVGTVVGGAGVVTLNISEVLPPANDDFASATTVASLPFSQPLDTTAATVELDEPTPSCGALSHTAWYSFSPAVTGSYVARLIGPFSNLIAVYTGSALGSLTSVGCQNSPNFLTFQATAGTTYHLQTFATGPMTVEIDVAPLPVASFSAPFEPSIFETNEFDDFSFDPAGVRIATRAWDFGDGATAGNVCCPTHRYTSDGDYTVTLVVTTPDGRQASATRLVQVRTHDVAITKFSVPTSAKSNQTRQLTVALKNTRYPETVSVQLYRSMPGFFGWELVGTTTGLVPVLKGGRTTDVAFTYTFTSADATVGKVSFRAVATIVGPRDAVLADNEAIASPTKVTR